MYSQLCQPSFKVTLASSSPTRVGLNENISLPDIPMLRPALSFSFLSLISFSAASFFSRSFRFFQATNVCRVTFVKSDRVLSSDRFCSISSSIEICSTFSRAFLSWKRNYSRCLSACMLHSYTNHWMKQLTQNVSNDFWVTYKDSSHRALDS